MKNISCGLLMYYKSGTEIKYFLVHPGGPYFKNRDLGYWSIPKGLVEEEDEDYLETAKREFEEETGIKPKGEYFPLDTIIQKNGKLVYAWAFQTESCEAIEINCNTFMLEFPPKSGKRIEIPEVDRGEFFDYEEAVTKINPAQIDFLDRLNHRI